MFGMSLGEIFIIAIIAILFVGPDKLPHMMVKIAKFFTSVKKTVNETKESIEQEIHLADLKNEALSYKEGLEKVVEDYKKETDISIIDDLNSEVGDIKESLTKLEKPRKKKKKKSKKSKDIKDV